MPPLELPKVEDSDSKAKASEDVSGKKESTKGEEEVKGDRKVDENVHKEL